MLWAEFTPTLLSPVEPNLGVVTPLVQFVWVTDQTTSLSPSVSQQQTVLVRLPGVVSDRCQVNSAVVHFFCEHLSNQSQEVI